MYDVLAMSFSELRNKEELGHILCPSSATSCSQHFLDTFDVTIKNIYFRVGMI